MSDPLQLELFGGFRATIGRDRSCRLPTRRAEALLAYLAMPAGRFHSRDRLAALLWGNAPEALARQSLRQALASIRRSWGARAESILLTQGDSVALDPARVSID